MSLLRWMMAGSLVISAQGQWLPGLDPSVPEGDPVEALPDVRRDGGTGEERGTRLMVRLDRLELVSWRAGEFGDAGGGVFFEEALLLPSPRALATKLRRKIGEEIYQADLLWIAEAILLHYGVEGYPVVSVDVPQQDLSKGVLRILVEPGRIGRVAVANPKYGERKWLSRGLRLEEGEVLQSKALDQQLWWYGRNIFRKPRLFVAPGIEPVTADLVIALEERRPWRVNLGYDNFSTDLLGRDRLTVGAAGLLPNEHVIGWQSVAGLPASSLSAHALSWEIPFHRQHQTLTLDAAYAKVRASSVSSGTITESEGASWSLGATQRIPIPGHQGWRQRLLVGAEVKSTDQFVLFGAGSFSPGEVRLVHGKLGVESQRRWDDGGAAFEGMALWSPGGLISGNDDPDFQAYDPRATSSYVIGRVSGSAWWSPGADWRLVWRGAAQASDSRLLPSEQLAAGGANSVRGVAEREGFADQGWQTTFEVVTPAWQPRKSMALRGVTFFDHASLQNRSGMSQSLSGAGIGIRMEIARGLDLRVDQGWRLDGGGSRTHVAVGWTF